MMWRSCGLLLLIFSECLTTKITNLDVPSLVRLGEEEVLLDCEYELESDIGLVVKWYFNNALVYQWINDMAPQALGILKDHLDLSYNASSEPTQRYRALRILKPTTSFSGDYSCSVFTYVSESIQRAHMQLYDPGQGPELRYVKLQDVGDNDNDGDDDDHAEEDDEQTKVLIDCDASEVYPLPELTITVDGEVVNQTQANWNASEGRYNASVSAELYQDTLESGAELRCELVLPGADYNNTDSVIYYVGGLTTTETEEGAGSERPAAVGSGSAWAGSSGDRLMYSLSLLALGFLSTVWQRYQQRQQH